MSDSSESPQPSEGVATAKSPFAGCSIFILAVVMMICLIGFALWSLRYQEKTIATFTEEQANPVPLLVPTEVIDEMNTLAAKLKDFQDQVALEKDTSLELSAREINLAIAQYDILKELRSTFSVNEITPEHMLIQISYKMGNSPFSKRKNYLNGNMQATPELLSGEVLLRISSITPAVGEVPKPVLEHMSAHRIMEVYKEHPVLGPLMKKFTSVSLENDAVIVRVDPAAKPPAGNQADIATSSSRALKLFGVIATLLLATVATILYIGHKKSVERGRLR